MSEAFGTLLYGRDARNPRIARITLNRPERLNAISPQMPGEIRRAVELANGDDGVHVIVVQGVGEKHGFHSAVEWRDSGRPIPEGGEARELARTLRGK